MAQRTISNDLREAMKELRLGQLLPTLAERITLAEAQQLPIEDFLVALFSDEISRRHDTSAGRRAASAGLDPDMIFDRWDKSAKISLDRRVLQELMSLRFVETSRNVVVLGPVGVGKTFLACALGHLACRSAFHVRFSRADALLRLLRQSRLDNSREALMAELCAVDLLILDDFALEPMSRDESRDIYQLFVERTARASTIITSNRDTADWLAFFDDPMLAQSALDRFRNNAYDLVVDGESYRSRLKPSIEKDGPPPPAPVVKQKTPIRRRPRPRG
jgi:DNA replication protein DnaC